MTVSPMEADVDASAAAAGDEEALPLVEFPALKDPETGEPAKFAVREQTPGQVITLLNTVRRRGSTEDSVKRMARMLRMIVALIDSEDDRDWVEDAMAEGEVDIDDLMEFFEKITEGLTGRPTESSPASKPTRVAPGPTSPVRSARRVNRSKNSA